MLAPYVHDGMTVLEPGPGMGFFTLELARLVGASGRVVAVDIQPKMLSRLKRRLERAGLAERVDIRLCSQDSLGLADGLSVDFTLAFAMVHELTNEAHFFKEVAKVSKTGAQVLLCEPKGHVTRSKFQEELQLAERTGLQVVGHPNVPRSHAALLEKSR